MDVKSNTKTIKEADFGVGEKNHPTPKSCPKSSHIFFHKLIYYSNCTLRKMGVNYTK